MIFAGRHEVSMHCNVSDLEEDGRTLERLSSVPQRGDATRGHWAGAIVVQASIAAARQQNRSMGASIHPEPGTSGSALPSTRQS
jgi:hypothetical protein